MTAATTLAHAAAVIRRRAPRGDRGAFAALELVILLPFVIIMILVVAAFGRVERGRELVDQAAAAAARAGSLSTNAITAQQAAQSAAEQTLRDGGMSCSSVHEQLDTSEFYPGGQVTANVSCVTKFGDLAMSALPGSLTLTARSTSILERNRPLSGGQT